MKCKLQPLGDRVAVKRDDAETISKGGIIYPASMAEKKLCYGTVAAVGRGFRVSTGDLMPLELKAGDRVAFGQYAGSEIMCEGEVYVMMREDDILTKLPGQEL